MMYAGWHIKFTMWLSEFKICFQETGIYLLLLSYNSAIPCVHGQSRDHQKQVEKGPQLLLVRMIKPLNDLIDKRGGEILLAVGKVKQPWRNLSSIITGRTITEQDVFFKKSRHSIIPEVKERKKNHQERKWQRKWKRIGKIIRN